MRVTTARMVLGSGVILVSTVRPPDCLLVSVSVTWYMSRKTSGQNRRFRNTYDFRNRMEVFRCFRC